MSEGKVILVVNSNNSLFFPKHIRHLKGIKEGTRFEASEENGDLTLKMLKDDNDDNP